MLDDSSDPILTTIRRIGLFNSSADRVKVGLANGKGSSLDITLLIYLVCRLCCLERTLASEAN